MADQKHRSKDEKVEEKNVLATIDDWINQVEQKQAALSGQKPKPDEKLYTGKYNLVTFEKDEI